MSQDLPAALVNKGLAEINAQPFGDQATLAVVGLTRSGTSMLSALLKTFGIHMGEVVDSAVYEDVEVAKFIDAKDFAGLKAFIAKRNAEHAVWGFKRPNAYKVLKQLTPMMRKPRIIVTFRDVLAIAMRNHVSMQMDVLSALPRYADEYQELIRNIAPLKCPMLLVSYEKFIQFPEESIVRTARFAGIEPTAEMIAKGMDTVKNGPEAYLKASRLRYTGHVDRIVNGKLRGWAMVIDQPKLKANVQLKVNGQVAASAVANVRRKDLVDAGIGDGHHGFEIDIDNSMSRDNVIEVTAGNSSTVLPNSGKKAIAYGLV
ncbi:hypothetical protein [Aestuariivirga sp.]|uniref:hypothetical protein n=1 Tax=Aestuariivirga sp. TaxID=2650926 RepID=UPI003593CE8E